MATVNRLPRLQCWLRLMIDWAAHRRLQTHLTRLPLPLGHPQLVTYCDVTFPACTLLHRQHCTQGYPDEQNLANLIHVKGALCCRTRAWLARADRMAVHDVWHVSADACSSKQGVPR